MDSEEHNRGVGHNSKEGDKLQAKQERLGVFIQQTRRNVEIALVGLHRE
jgi:hypothetical protein